MDLLSTHYKMNLIELRRPFNIIIVVGGMPGNTDRARKQEGAGASYGLTNFLLFLLEFQFNQHYRSGIH